MLKVKSNGAVGTPVLFYCPHIQHVQSHMYVTEYVADAKYIWPNASDNNNF